MKKKKVCFLCPYLGNSGGIQQVVTNLGNNLSKCNFDITFCVLDGIDNKVFYKTDENIKILYLGQLRRKNNGYINRIMFKLINKGILTKISSTIKLKILCPNKRVKILQEYLNSNHYDYVIGVSAEYSLLLSCIKNTAMKLYGWQHNSFDAYFNTRGQYCYNYEDVIRKQFKLLDKIIVLTKKDKEIYKGFFNEKVIYIYNPLTFSTKEITNFENNILFVGRLMKEQKGLDFLIEIAKRIFKIEKNKKWKLIIVGDGKDKEELVELVKKNNLKDNIIIVGESKDVKSFYLKSSIFVNTSRWEGFGLVITEAMECGLVPVSFSTDGPSEIITNGKNGILIECYDIDKYANAIIELIEDKERLLKMSLKARERANDFKSENIIKEWKNNILSEEKKDGK